MRTQDLSLNTLAGHLAVELTIITGETWRARIDPSESHQRPHIDSPSATLYLSQEWNTNRLSVRASAPEGMREMKTGEKITCNPERTPEAIARDINSRLINHARAHLIESAAYDLQKRKEAARKNIIRNLIMKYLPKEYQDQKWCTNKESPTAYKERIYAETTYDDLIHIEINLELPAALKLLKQLTQGENQQ